MGEAGQHRETPGGVSPRRLVAILAADVVGYSRLVGEDEAAALAALRRMFAEVARPVIEDHGGRIFKTMGDGFLAEFPSAVSAVLSADGIQRAMTDHKPLVLRIGVHLGDVVPDGADMLGDGVNVAARLEGIASPGGVTLSGAVADAVRGKVPFGLKDGGERALKNIEHPVRIFEISGTKADDTKVRAEPRLLRRRRTVMAAALAVCVVCAVLGWRAWRDDAPGSAASAVPTESARSAAPARTREDVPRLSFVVLPFANRSGDPGQDYFVDGLTDSLTTDLSRIDGSFVIARGTAFAFRDKPIDLRQLGRELGVRYVIGGSVLRTGDRVRVTAELVEADNARTLWSDSFDGDAPDLLDLVDRTTARIARAVGVTSLENESRRITRAENAGAADFALRGWATINRPRPGYLDDAEQYFQQASKADPTLVGALNGLAWVEAQRLGSSLTSDRHASARKAEAWTEAVLRREPENATAHLIQCWTLQQTDRAQRSIESCRRAIAASPNWAFAYYVLQTSYLLTGRPDEALRHIDKAIRLSPKDPFMGSFLYVRGADLFMLGRYREALDSLEGWSPPVGAFNRLYRAAAYALLGQSEEARRWVQEVLAMNPNWTVAAERARGLALSSNPDFQKLRERMLDGLRRAGLPEGPS
jgi:TolB-like protein/class 3 adenylate cyclase